MLDKKHSIVLIDDDFATNIYHEIIVKESLFFEAHHIYDSAADALELLTNGTLNPTFILLDINMPGMNGWDFLDSYSQKQTDINNIPTIILLTTSLSTFDLNQGKNHPYVKDIFEKPLTVELLKDMIQKQIR